MGTPNDGHTVSTRRFLSRKAASRRRRALARPVASAARAAEFEMLETRQLLSGSAPTLTSVNTIPNATEDTAIAISYATLKAASNVADAESDPITFRIEAVSTGTLKKGTTVVVPGTTTIASTDTLTWTPAANANGTLNAFTIKAFDGLSYSTTAVQVRVDTAPVNDAPAISAVATLTGANEDTDYAITYSALSAAATTTDPDADTLSFQVAAVSSGTLKINGIAVNPSDNSRNKLNPGDTWVWHPAANASGTLNAFTVKVFDGTVASPTAVQVKVTVAAVNDAPTLTNVNTLTAATEDAAYTITYAQLVAASNINDVDGTSPMFRVHSVSSGTLTKSGSAVTADTTTLGTGESWVWTPAANANGVLPAFTVVAWDSTLASATPLQVNVNVAAVNDAPVFGGIDPFLDGIEDMPYEFSWDALTGAADVSDIDSSTISWHITATSTGQLLDGNLNVINSGITTVHPGESVYWQPAANANGTLNAFVVKANDGTSDSSASSTVTLAVAATPDAPTLTTVSTLAGGTEDTAYSITFANFAAAANEADADGDTLSFRIESVTSGTLTKGGTPVTPGTTLFATGDTLVWTPAADANGTAVSAFTVRATDGTYLSGPPVQVKVAVAGANDVPTMSQITTLSSANEDTAFTISYATLKAATDVTDLDGDAIQFRIESVTTGTLKKNGVAVVAGTTLVAANDNLAWTPAADANGVLNAFTVKAWDGAAASATALQVKVAVTAVNDAPTLTAIANLTGGTEDTAYNVTYANIVTAAGSSVNDVDSATVNYQITSLGTGTLAKNGLPVSVGYVIATGDTLVWTPAANANGSTTNALTAFSVKATDGALLSANAIAVKVNVANVNDAPTLSTISNLTGATEDIAYTITYANLAAASNASDIEGPVLFRIESVTAGTLTKGGAAVTAGTTTLGTGETLVWTPAANTNGVGTSAFTVKAYDGALASPTAVQVKVNVTAVNDAPTMTTIANLTGGTEDTPYTITYANLLSASNAADVDSNISFTIAAVSAGTLTKNGSPVVANTTQLATGESLVWTPAANVNGTGVQAFTVKATDGTLTTGTAIPVKVNLAAVNDAPTMTTVANLTGASEDTAYNITYAQLKTASNTADVDVPADTLTFRIEGVLSGTLTKGGVAVTAGTTTIAAGDTVVWTPAADAYGTGFNALPAFSIKAFDGTAYSAAPVAVKVDTANVNDAPTLTTITAFGTATSDQATEDTPYDFTYAALAANANEADIDNSVIYFRVEAVSTGTLKKNGVAVVAGTTTLGPGETFSWTPAANANGNSVNAFTLKAWDGAAASATAIQVVTDVDSVNDAPTLTAVATLTTNTAADTPTEDTAFDIDFAAFNTAATKGDVDGDTVSYRIEAVSSGTLELNGVTVVPGTDVFAAGDTLTWTPAADANGTLNAFTVTATDGTLFSATPVQVKVTVTAVNDATPSFGSGTALAGGTEDTAITITYAQLLTASGMTDPDPEQTLQFRIDSITAGTLTKNGTAVTVGASGTLLGVGESLVYTPAANANGAATDIFVVKGYDGVANGTTFQVQLDITAVNDTPTLTSVPTLTTNTASDTPTEDTAFDIDFAWFDAHNNHADVDTGDTVSYRIESVTNGTLLINAGAVTPGTTVFTTGDTLTWTPSADANGTVPAFKVTATDGTLFSATPIQVSVTVTGAPDAPTLTTVNTFTKGVENTGLTISFADLLANSDLVDPDGGAVMFRVEAVSTGTLTKGGVAVTGGTTTLGTGESLVWTPDPNTSGNGANAFTVVGYDGSLDSGTPVQVVVNVAHVAPLPTLTTITALTTNTASDTPTEDTAFSIDFAWFAAATNAVDPEAGTISYRIESVLNGTLTKGGVAVVPGTTVFATGDTLVWTPAANANGTLPAFTVRAKSAAGVSATAVTASVTVTGVNDTPTLTAVTPFSGAGEDFGYTIKFADLLAGSDAKDLDGDTLVFTVEAVSTGTLTKGGVAVTAGTTTIGAGETLVWTPDADANGVLNAFTVTANDGTAPSAAPVQVKVQVTPINDAPTLTTMADIAGPATAATPFSITYADLTGAGNEANPEGATVNFVIASVLSGTLTKNGVAVIPGVTRVKTGDTIVWTSAAGATGSTPAFTVLATDGQALSSTPVAVNVVVS